MQGGRVEGGLGDLRVTVRRCAIADGAIRAQLLFHFDDVTPYRLLGLVTLWR